MKMEAFVLALGVYLASLQALAANIDRSFESRIISACINSVEREGKRIPNHRAVCRCIGETHYTSASRESVQAEAEEHISWTTSFYETSDKAALQNMVDRNPIWSSFDDQVVDDCIRSANRGSRR